MITKIVVLKVIRAFFGKKEPLEVMLGFFDEKGKPVGSQLVSADLFEITVSEGQSVDFKTTVHQVVNLLDSPGH
jgi:hypothetical protein